MICVVELLTLKIKNKTKYQIAISGDMSLWACGFVGFGVSVTFCLLFVFLIFPTPPFYLYILSDTEYQST